MYGQNVVVVGFAFNQIFAFFLNFFVHYITSFSHSQINNYQPIVLVSARTSSLSLL